MAKLVQMKGQGCWSQAEAFANLASRQTDRTGLHQQPEHVEAGFLSERRESGYCGLSFHISNMIEL